EVEGAGGSEDAEAHVGPAAGDGGGDGQVGVCLAVVALDLLRTDAELAEAVVEQLARAGAALAVQEEEVAARQVLQAADAARVPLRDDQTLLPPRQVDQRHLPRREEPRNPGDVVLAGLLVDQVRARQVALAPLQGG